MQVRIMIRIVVWKFQFSVQVLLIGVGVVYGMMEMMWLIRFSFIVVQVSIVFIIGVSRNGIKNIGFMMIGVLKIIGLLILNRFGIMFK